jgi:hypothetical protein
MTNYKDVHESSMQEDRSEKPPYLGPVSHSVGIIASKCVENNP